MGLGLVPFIVALMIGGLALDLMRHEAARLDLQTALERSTLAAAALIRDLDREARMRDDTAEARLGDLLERVRLADDGDAAAR